MSKAALVSLSAGILLLALPSFAQAFQAQGIGDSEKSAKRDAEWKLEFQIEVSVNSISAFSDIVEELGESMKYDPASDMVIQPTTSLGLAGLDYKLAPRKGYPDPFKMSTTLDVKKIAGFYPQGLEKVRQEIDNMTEALKNSPDLEYRQSALEELVDFMREFGNFRNLAVLLGIAIPNSPSIKPLQISSEKELDQVRTESDSLPRLGQQIAALASSGPVFIDFSPELRAAGNFQYQDLLAEIALVLKEKGLKLAASQKDAGSVLRVTLLDKDAASGREYQEVSARAVILKGLDSGLITKAGVFTLAL